MLRLGIDVGSVSAQLALLGDDGAPLWSGSAALGGEARATLAALVDALVDETGLDAAAVALVDGARPLLAASLPAAREVSEVVAAARGVAALCPDVHAAIEVGGHPTRWIELEQRDAELADFALSELCAAGAGAFLEQQAGRLDMDIEGFAAMAAGAARGATVAGRCAVFAKSDMIHLQQEGTPAEEIALGLCLALVRNFQATVLRGRTLRTPLALVGGGARNAGLVRAVREVLGLDGDALVVPARPERTTAIGAARLAAGGSPIALATLRAALGNGAARPRALTRLPALPDPGGEPPPAEPGGEGIGDDGRVLLGVDVGSVSTNLALLTPGGEVVDAVYLRTRGRPLDALQRGIAALRGRHGERLRVVGVGTTGSGRHLAGRFLGADRVHNEITAQLRSSVAYLPSVDTVLEIGGQDAKYIHAVDGHIADFTMNKICAAGTGSFLEEQAERLGISIIGEFAEHALAADAPVDLGCRCTVFMDSELVHAQRRGATSGELCAGLALSVARNYLDRVVAGRPIGAQVLFQGGTASNRAVVAAFRQLLGRPVAVHPYNRVSGAVGAALLVRDARAEGVIGEATAFRGFDACRGELERSFECARCSNRCQVNRYRSGERVLFFGDTCERYSSRDGRGGSAAGPGAAPRDTLAEMERRLHAAARIREDAPVVDAERAIGIPRAPLPYALLPLWTSLARAAGVQPVLSSPSSPPLLTAGLRKLSAETCLPVKLAYGHVDDLVRRGVQRVLLPSVVSLPPRQARGDRPYTCPYTQHVPYMVRTTVDATLIAPQVELERGPDRALVDPAQLAAELGIDGRALSAAMREGWGDLQRYRRALRSLGDEVLAGVEDRALVVVGKPYNLLDPFLNLRLGRHLQRLGMPFVPAEALPLEEVELSERWFDLPWGLNRDYVRAALWMRDDPRLFPVVLSSFGCGPDGFTVKHVDAMLGDRPRLLLELDEHRAEAGLVTRLEAFADEIDTHVRRRRGPALRPPRDAGPLPVVRRGEGRRFFLPYAFDHVHAFAGALRRAGHEAIVLPPPDEATRQLGDEVASGRECDAYAPIAGDLVRLLRDERLRPGDALFFPGALNACLIPQYRDAMMLAARRLGAEPVAIVSPVVDAMLPLFGVGGVFALWRGLVAIDHLLRAVCERRPYERHAGDADRVHRWALGAIGDAVAGELDLIDVVTETAGRLRAIPRSDGPRRPRVGVAGDVYTRINPFASGDLFARLERLGCEVWPASTVVDVTDFNVEHRHVHARRHRDLRELLRTGLYGAYKDRQTARITRAFGGLARQTPDPPYAEVLASTEPYLGPESNNLVMLNVAKMIDFARGGAAGVVNAICFNCMVGTVSASLTERLRRDLDGVPMATLVCGGTEATASDARLEAFVHQVHRFAARRADSIS